MLFLLSLFTLFTVLAIKLCIEPLLKYKKYLRNMPCPPYSLPPPIGHSFIISKDPKILMSQVLQWSIQYPKIFYIWLVLNTPEAIECALKSSKHNEKGAMYDFFRPWLRRGLLVSYGDYWKGRRKMLTPAFHFAILKSFFDTIQEQSEKLVDLLDAQYGGKGKFDIFPKIAHAALDIICETAMGVHPNSQEECNSPYVRAVNESNGILLQRMSSPYLWPDWMFKMSQAGKRFYSSLRILHDFTQKAMADRRLLKGDALKNEEEKEKSVLKNKIRFLDLLLQEPSLTDADIQEEVDTFMFEGFDTTSVSMSWTIYLLIRHPKVLLKVQQEVDAVFNGSKKLSFESLNELVYLEQVIKESLRLFPSVPVFMRVASQADCFEGFDTPAGVQLVVSPYALHRNPNVWKNPTDFDPDRFSAAECDKRHPFAYIPFSAGQRNCIGQKFALIEEKTLLAHVLHSFHFDIVDDVEEALHKFKPSGELIMRPVDGVYVSLKKQEAKRV